MFTVQQKRIFPPLDHYDWTVIEKECGCAVCEAERACLSLMNALVVATSDHKVRCKCELCRKRAIARTSYFAASERRTLYSESSFHAREGRLGQGFMDWIITVLEDKSKTDGWWMIQAPWKHMGNWFLDYSRSQAAPVVSGRAA